MDKKFQSKNRRKESDNWHMVTMTVRQIINLTSVRRRRKNIDSSSKSNPSRRRQKNYDASTWRRWRRRQRRKKSRHSFRQPMPTVLQSISQWINKTNRYTNIIGQLNAQYQIKSCTMADEKHSLFWLAKSKQSITTNQILCVQTEEEEEKIQL